MNSAIVARERFELARRPPDERRAGLHRVGADTRCRGAPQTRLRARTCISLLVAPALFLEIDAHHPRRELRQEPRGADDADRDT